MRAKQPRWPWLLAALAVLIVVLAWSYPVDREPEPDSLRDEPVARPHCPRLLATPTPRRLGLIEVPAASAHQDDHAPAGALAGEVDFSWSTTLRAVRPLRAHDPTERVVVHHGRYALLAQLGLVGVRWIADGDYVPVLAITAMPIWKARLPLPV